MSEEKKTDEQAAATFLRSLGLGRGVERGEDSGKVRATVALIQAVRAERDAELALDRAVVESALRWGDGRCDDNETHMALVRAIMAKKAALAKAPQPPRAAPPKSAETQETKACPACKGSGWASKRNACRFCQGTGRVPTEGAAGRKDGEHA